MYSYLLHTLYFITHTDTCYITYSSVAPCSVSNITSSLDSLRTDFQQLLWKTI